MNILYPQIIILILHLISTYKGKHGNLNPKSIIVEGALTMVEVRPVKNEQELNDMFYQRWLVLRAPLGMIRGTEKDKYEDNAFHLVALCDSQIIGSARLRLLSSKLGSIAYVAVLPEFRNQGIGTKLMEKLIKTATEQNLKTLRLMTRVSAINFYARLGFVPEGEFFDYLDISHIFMYYKLEAFFPPARD